MTCAEIRERLDDFLDGDLSEAQFQEVEVHLAACRSCREEEKALRLLLARAAALPREIAPSRDIWPGIAERIHPSSVSTGEGQPRRRGVLQFQAAWRTSGGRVALAAAATVLIALSIRLIPGLPGVAPRSPSRTANGKSGPVAGGNDVVPMRDREGGIQTAGGRAGSPTLAATELEYRRAATDLRRALDARRKTLSPETLTAIDANLQIIDDAIREIRLAMEKDPANPGLARMLYATHRKKLNVLRQVTRLKA